MKTLVLVCDGAFVLALVPGDRRADEAAVGSAVAAQHVRFARADEVVVATGFEPGAVAPFPQRSITHALMDRSLLAHDVVWIGAGTAAHMASIAPGELLRLSGARAVDLVIHR